MSPKRMLNERKKLRQWQAAQMQNLLYPSSYERFLIFPSIYERILADKKEPIFRTFEEAYRKAFREALEESINEDPFFRAFDEALAENPDADPNAIWSLLELAYPFEDPDDPDEPMPRQVFVAPAVIIRRRSYSQGRRSSGNGTGNGKGGGDGGNGDGDDDSNADSDNHIKIRARAWTRASQTFATKGGVLTCRPYIPYLIYRKPTKQ